MERVRGPNTVVKNTIAFFFILKDPIQFETGELGDFLARIKRLKKNTAPPLE